ncbi:hypothetical protein KHP62_00610 [Rhodobacteraceae bacterium NNCM2]|nr:hypothetical protein [Coraliihabitans acroporae]
MKTILRVFAVVLMFWATLAQAQISDKTEIAKALFLEALRKTPSLADQEDTRYSAQVNFIEPGSAKAFYQMTAEQKQQRLEAAGAWIAKQLQQASALPLKIEVAFPASIRLNDDGSLMIAGNLGKNPPIISGTIEQVTVKAPQQSPSVVIRPVQPFDLSSITPPDGVKARLEEFAKKRQGVMLVAVIEVAELSSAAQNKAGLAGGLVEALAIHELTAVDRQLVAGDPIWALPAAAPRQNAVTLSEVEAALRLQKRDGRYLDSRQGGTGPLNQLLQWRALAALPVEEVIERRLSDDLFWFIYGQFAPRALQDDLIPPHKLIESRDRFSPLVNDIEQRQLEDRVIRALWPEIAAALPGEPVPVTSTVVVPMADYDFQRGGFPVNFRAGGWLLGTQYPILTGLPDLLPVAQEQATKILDRMTAIDGPGRKMLTVMADFDLTTREVTFEPEGPLRLPRVTPGFDLKSASIHAASRHPDTASLERNKLIDLDPAKHRGPEKPVADRAELDTWTETIEGEGARGEDLIAAAMAVADDPAAIAQAMNRQGRVSDPLGAAQSLTLPDPPVLTGNMSFAKQGAGWTATGFRWTYRSNESGLDAPQVELADTAILTNLPLAEEQEQAMQAVGGQVQYRATFEPVAAAVKGGRTSVYVRLTEIALYSPRKDETGLPLLRVVLTAKDAPTPAPVSAGTSGKLSKRPALVLLDHDYLDLLQVREMGSDLDDATLDRMLLDRMHRELRTTNDKDLGWGRFFNPLPTSLNRVQRAELLPAFRAWQEARAAALPENVVVRVATNAISAGCGALSYASPAQANAFSPGVRAMLEAMQYDSVSKSVGNTLGMLEKVAREVPERRPVLAPERLVQIGGRPIYQLLRVARHTSLSACIGQERFDAVTDGFDPAASRSADAVLVLKSPILVANERREVVETRHLAKVTGVTFAAAPAGGTGPRNPGTFRIELDVTDSIFYGQNALPQRHMPNPTGKPVRLSVAQVAQLSVPAPTVADIKGMSLETSAEDMQITLLANGVGQRNFEQAFARQIAPQSVPGHGTMPATEAITHAMMLIDMAEEEAILSLSDARTGTPRIGLGRFKLYDPAKVTSNGLAGALLKKYGEPSFAEQDRRGGTALNRYIWGYHPAISMPHCLPQINDRVTRQMRDAFVIRDDTDRQYHTMVQAMPWPSFGPLADGLPDLSGCQPFVLAEISTHSGKLSLTTWVIDPSALAKLPWRAETSIEPNAAEAADVDL